MDWLVALLSGPNALQVRDWTVTLSAMEKLESFSPSSLLKPPTVILYFDQLRQACVSVCVCARAAFKRVIDEAEDGTAHVTKASWVKRLLYSLTS